MNATTPPLGNQPSSADCHQPDSRVHLAAATAFAVDYRAKFLKTAVKITDDLDVLPSFCDYLGCALALPTDH